ncbi:hypothetical protein GFJ94_03555 [Flavobacterium sp. LMO8]|uniref:STM3941 family protein n=1 Tax=Flavobacterium sp. LMO8 TaxID=2654244 RepID=UPI001291B570|nr:STM3941 family protein [Flavobacterium sp. LMO8]MQP24137.1 hypothetical protein [Flavobacterium sp. LMO8]
MIKKIKFRKVKILLGAFITLLLFLSSFYFLLKPEFFIRNVFTKVIIIQILGVIGMIYFLALFYSILTLFSRKYAIIITDEFLIDNSKYESFGKVEWNTILRIEKFKRKSIQIFVDENFIKNRKMNILENFLVLMHNWNYKRSIIISNALLDCSIEQLYEEIILAHEKHKENYK